MKPRLLFSELTGQVYVVTRYTERPSRTMPGRAIIVASTKYDVTEDFRDIIRGNKKRKLLGLSRRTPTQTDATKGTP